MKLGLFPGSFNPIHAGHLAVAAAAKEALGLDRVVFIVSPRPPHKDARALAPARHRLAMARLAVRGLPGFEVSDVELRRRGPSYTIDTVKAFRGKLYLIVGADTLAEIGTWRSAAEVRRRVTLAVYARRGSRLRRGRGIVALPGAAVDVAARTLRARIRRRMPITGWVPRAVEKYVYSRRLYR